MNFATKIVVKTNFENNILRLLSGGNNELKYAKLIH